MKLLSLTLLLVVQLTAFAQFKNIKLAEQVEGVYPPVEPSIAINKKNPKNIVAGVVLDRAIYTMDGGETWSESKLESPYGVFGDPALVSDAKGQIYYFHLADPSKQSGSNEDKLDRIVCQKSTDGGKTWSEGASIGNNPPKDQDKAWPTEASVNPCPSTRAMRVKKKSRRPTTTTLPATPLRPPPPLTM